MRPSLRSHAEEILKTLRDIATDIAANEVVRNMAKETANEMFHDPQLRTILAKTVQDVLSDPAPLQQTLQRNWRVIPVGVSLQPCSR